MTQVARTATRRALNGILIAALAGLLPVRAAAPDEPRKEPASSPQPPHLERALAEFLALDAFRLATWGLHVALVDPPRILFATNDALLLKPASNAKLFTAALALDHLGPTGRIRTDLLPAGRVSRSGTLHGDLVVVGHGDFSAAARFHPRESGGPFASHIHALHAAGIRRIHGDVIADDAAFRGAHFGTGWTWDDTRHAYGAPVGALNCDDNLLQVVIRWNPARSRKPLVEVTPPTSFFKFDTRGLVAAPEGTPADLGSSRVRDDRRVRLTGLLPRGNPVTHEIPVPAPALFYAHRLVEELTRAGIHVTGRPRHVPGAGAALPPTRLQHTLAVESPPAAELAANMLRPSQNLYAQALLLHVGSRATIRTPDPRGTTEAAGILALRHFLGSMGIATNEVLLDEGSGLSRSALVTPRAIISLLRGMERHPAGPAFLDALPVAGRDGTLRRRLRDTAAEGNLRGKTGTLRHVNALSGFVTNRDGRRLVFSALLNAYAPSQGAPSGRQAVDEVARLLAECPLEP